jgi:hypothetical protein
VLVLLESYLIRRMVCRLTTKNYNRFFLKLVKAVERAGEVSARTVSEFFLKAKSDSTRFPTDDELKRALLDYPIYSQLVQYKVRAVLAAFDRTFETGKS